MILMAVIPGKTESGPTVIWRGPYSYLVSTSICEFN